MAGQRGRTSLWILWGILSVAGASYLTAGIVNRSDRDGLLASARTVFLPGPTTHGHHQIELACESCHSEPFASPEVLQESCVGCHAAQLKAAEDKHSLTKFRNPRNAELLERIDATLCVTCHVEHRPRMTNAMGVSLPDDLCAHCHRDIVQERPSHAGMAFETCASAGCHNFHDNRALYEDFLLRHLEDADVLARPAVAARDFAEMASMLPDYPSDRYPVKPLKRDRADAPRQWRTTEAVVNDWQASSHAAAGVNCSGCHVVDRDSSAAWIERPDQRVCETCHAPEVSGFVSGKHGMRLAQGMGPMTPAQARLPMQEAASQRELTCTTYHGAHDFDTEHAAVGACLECHADEHSRAYRESKHFQLWQQELAGTAQSGAGVSCATCHLPRIEHRDPELDLSRTLVQHNQNDTLRPNEKMLRPACLSCHGLGFAIDALADPALIRRNFNGRPQQHVPSLQMARRRLREHEAQRRAAMPTSVQ